jgi:hypothetical membrane protein
MTKIRWGALCWILCAMVYPAQLAAALQWPQKYSWTQNLISDLGVTACGIYDAGTRVERGICSPWHLMANASTVGNGLLLAAGCALLWSAWPNLRLGRIALGFLTAGGLLLAAVGLLPLDLHPDGHNAAALLQAVFQWCGMGLLILAVRGTSEYRAVAGLTAAVLLVSVAGFALFITAVGGQPAVPGLGLGLTERIAFDSLNLWGVGTALLLLRIQPIQPAALSPESSAAASDAASEVRSHQWKTPSGGN